MMRNRRNRRRHQKPSQLKMVLRKSPLLLMAVVLVYSVLLLRDIEIPTVLPVKQVQIEGDFHFLDRQHVQHVVAENIAEGYFGVDLKQIRDVLLPTPWIKEVSLRRKWPATVSVHIEEHTPVAYWNDDAYISATGDVFRPAKIDKQLSLPRLSGPDSQHDAMLKFMNVLYRKMASLDYEVTDLMLDERRAWRMVIENKGQMDASADKSVSTTDTIEVKLGRFETDKRLQRFIRVLPTLTREINLRDNRIEVIDMRYPNGFAVRMTDQNTVATTALIEMSLINAALITKGMPEKNINAHRTIKKSMRGV